MSCKAGLRARFSLVTEIAPERGLRRTGAPRGADCSASMDRGSTDADRARIAAWKQRRLILPGRYLHLFVQQAMEASRAGSRRRLNSCSFPGGSVPAKLSTRNRDRRCCCHVPITRAAISAPGTCERAATRHRRRLLGALEQPKARSNAGTARIRNRGGSPRREWRGFPGPPARRGRNGLSLRLISPCAAVTGNPPERSAAGRAGPSRSRVAALRLRLERGPAQDSHRRRRAAHPQVVADGLEEPGLRAPGSARWAQLA